MEFKQLQYFVASVDLGSMNRAAEALHVTQSYISKTIKSLEAELDIVLLDRTKSGVQITDAGRKVYAYAQKILTAEQQISDVRQEYAVRKFQVSAMPNYDLVHSFARFCRSEKQFVRYSQGSLEDVVHSVSHRQTELGFLLVSVYQQQILQSLFARNKVRFVPLCFAAPSVWVGPSNPHYREASIGWNALRKLRLVQTGEEEVSMLRHLGCIKGNLADAQTIQAAAIVSSELAMLELLRNTDMASIHYRLCSESPPFGELHSIALDGCGKIIQFGYLHRLEASLSPSGENCVHTLMAGIRPSEPPVQTGGDPAYREDLQQPPEPLSRANTRELP